MSSSNNLNQESLDELAKYIRQTLPLPKTITHLELNEAIESIRFHWQGREFLVRKSLEVLEVRGKQVFVTGASMLIQCALMKKTKNEKVLGAILGVVREAEELISSRNRTEAGLKLLATAKVSLMRLGGIRPPGDSGSFQPTISRAI